jgi:hypothetical protein
MIVNPPPPPFSLTLPTRRDHSSGNGPSDLTSSITA